MNEARLKFEAGDWYQNPKARAQRLSLNSLSKEARQVYARIELATMGYGQEKAVVSQEGDKRRLLTTNDIARDTELNEANVRRAFRELESQGLAERRAVDGGTLRKGNIAIYSTATPPCKPQEKKGGRARPPNSSRLPDSWAILTAFARREKIALPDEIEGARDLIERGEQIARDLENAQMRARAFCEEVSALAESADSIRKKEIDRQEEKEEAASSSDLPVPPESATTTPEPAAPAIEAEITRVWVEAGKDNPGPRQLETAIAALPPDPEGRTAFVEYLRGKVRKLNHPGALQGEAEGFSLRWANRAPPGPKLVNGVCAECRGIGIVSRVVRGIGVQERCPCGALERMEEIERRGMGVAMESDDEPKERGG